MPYVIPLPESSALFLSLDTAGWLLVLLREETATEVLPNTFLRNLILGKASWERTGKTLLHSSSGRLKASILLQSITRSKGTLQNWDRTTLAFPVSLSNMSSASEICPSVAKSHLQEIKHNFHLSIEFIFISWIVDTKRKKTRGQILFQKLNKTSKVFLLFGDCVSTRKCNPPIL